jgi:hypothetical protein
LPVINGFVEVPGLIDTENSRLTLSDALSAVPGSSTLVKPFVDKQRRLFVLPDFQSNLGYPNDYYQILRDAARSI